MVSEKEKRKRELHAKRVQLVSGLKTAEGRVNLLTTELSGWKQQIASYEERIDVIDQEFEQLYEEKQKEQQVAK